MKSMASLLLSVVLSGCTGGTFIPDLKTEEDKGKQEDATADEPVMTGGSFLVCNPDPAIVTADTNIGVGCRMENAKAEKVAIGPSLTWDVLLLVEDVETEMRVDNLTTEASQKWHWHMHVPKNKTQGAVLRVVFGKAGKAPVPYQADVEEVVKAPQTFNLSQDFPSGLLFGDNVGILSQANPGCQTLAAPQSGNEISNGTFRGEGGEFAFKAQRGGVTSLAIDLCGIETTSTGLQANLLSGSSLIATKDLPSGSAVVTFDFNMLPNVEYRLAFPKTTDDYRVRSIQGQSKATVEIVRTP